MASVTFDPVETRSGGGRKKRGGAASSRRPTSRKGPPPRPQAFRAACALIGLGFGVAVGLSVTSESLRQLHAPGGVALFLGNLTGMAGGYLALVMVLLVSRIPVVERVLGQDGLVRLHRRLSAWPLTLIAIHATLAVVAFAQAARSGLWREIGTMVGQYPWMIEATIGFGLMMAIGLVSIRAIRLRVSRERWWAFHLCMYLALSLSFGHVVVLGSAFVGHPFTRLIWELLWLASAGLVISYRIALPVYRSLRHRLEIVEVRPEGEGVVSVICRGRHLETLALSGGQFFEWRFLVRGMWWQAHPFSLSARPSPPYLRLTVKAVGDFSTAVARLKPGTRVGVEGPYGVFTTHARRRPKVALIAGGIGVTAVRCLLEDLPRGSDPVVILRASTAADLTLSGEVTELVRQRRGRVHELVGPRSSVNIDRLHELVPDLHQRDVFVSGPEEFVMRVVSVVARAGVPVDAIHYEVYAL